MTKEQRLIDVNAIPESATAVSTDGRLFVAWSAIVEAPYRGCSGVVHGQWKRTPTSQTLYCGVCDKISECQIETNYCPNCGAKMDGDPK